MKKVSIIVPVYNSDKYLSFCIDSLINQSYKNLEILLIDDGSTDKSLEICKKYSKIDSRIKFFHKENGGVASTRNYGLKFATGDYISFVDSDDYIDSLMIQILVEIIEKNKSDLSMCYYDNVSTHSHNLITNNQCVSYQNFTDYKEFYSIILNKQKVGGYIWNKLYKKNIIFKMKKFFCGDMLEDFEFNCRYLELCKKISLVESSLYFYYNNVEGLTKNFKIDIHKINGIKMYNKIIEFYKKYDKEDLEYIIFFALKYELNINYKSYIINKTTKKELIDKNKVLFLLSSKKNKLLNKIYILLLYVFPIFSFRIKYLITKK